MVLGADHVGDPVEHVLEGRDEVVGRPAVRADEHEVLELLVRVLDPAEDDVLPDGDALVGHPEADRALVLVGLAFGDELPSHLLRSFHPVELEGDLAVEVEPEPAERLLDLAYRLGDLAACVGVLDPQVELAALVPREQPVEQRGACTAHVQVAGRARREADANGHTVRLLACCSEPTVPGV